jgi:hypothetical protein
LDWSGLLRRELWVRFLQVSLEKAIAALSEIGVLLVALAPLEGFIKKGQDQNENKEIVARVILFVVLGACSFVGSVVLDWLFGDWIDRKEPRK